MFVARVTRTSWPFASGTYCEFAEFKMTAGRQPVEYYSEESFTESKGKGIRVYTGPGLFVGLSSVLFCFVMYGVTRKSNNLSFKWLQRRCGAQFGTCAYLITTNVMYVHDGDRWITRDADRIMKNMFGNVLWDVKKWRARTFGHDL